MKKIILLIFAFFVSLFKSPVPSATDSLTPNVFPTPTPTATPTPRSLTFSEMNTLYGPCVYLPTLIYHHVQSPGAAKAKNQVALTVRTADFRAQMQYLKDKAYNIISMQDLLNFFEQGTKLPKKSVLLTFDDGYSDFYTEAYPILREFGYSATVFIPTGLMNNTGYLYWDKISEMSANRILFANHTWSHKNVKTKEDVLKMEISTADVQLKEKGLNIPKVFAYPYGLEGNSAISFLQGLDYKLAFTTRSGGTLCKKQMLDLPRIRIGNGSLSIYGF